MKRSNLALLVLTIFTVACQSPIDRFTINGQISEAQDHMLYLDHMALDRIEVMDSVKLDAQGAFSFQCAAPTDCFDFYRLRLDNKVINLTVDSTETITVSASLPVMQMSYTVEGSDNSVRLKDMVIAEMGLLQELKSIASGYNSPDPAPLEQKIKEKVDVFKSSIMTEYILPDPSSACAYYALFMSINGQMLFNPQTDRQDAKCFAAVATQMDMLYPDATRTVHLHNLALKGMVRTTPPKNNDSLTAQVRQKLQSLIEETGLIEIELPDYKGQIRKLSDLKGDVVLLDFTAFKTEYSPNYNLMLRTLYNKYAERGFNIYQVSVDSDESFWLNTAPNLPWVCVYDEASLGSIYLKSYNIDLLPAVFLIDREGNIVDRPEKTDELDDKIAKLLE